MNNKEISTKNVQTMSSIEIAEMTGKSHRHVLADIRKVLNAANISAADFSAVYKNQQDRDIPCFNLPRRECDLVISGYSVPYRLAIIDRWNELEEKVLLIAKPYEGVSTEKLKEFRLVSKQLAINYLIECGVDTSCLQNKEKVANTSRTGYVIPSAEASILRLFENCPAARTERNIIQSKLATNPFKSMAGNKSNAIRSTLKDMVDKGMITNIWKNGANRYSIAA